MWSDVVAMRTICLPLIEASVNGLGTLAACGVAVPR
jgi:hypothetical protein